MVLTCHWRFQPRFKTFLLKENDDGEEEATWVRSVSIPSKGNIGIWLPLPPINFVDTDYLIFHHWYKTSTRKMVKFKVASNIIPDTKNLYIIDGYQYHLDWWHCASWFLTNENTNMYDFRKINNNCRKLKKYDCHQARDNSMVSQAIIWRWKMKYCLCAFFYHPRLINQE